MQKESPSVELLYGVQFSELRSYSNPYIHLIHSPFVGQGDDWVNFCDVSAFIGHLEQRKS